MQFMFITFDGQHKILEYMLLKDLNLEMDLIFPNPLVLDKCFSIRIYTDLVVYFPFY
jgi:hypothetical protein